MSGLTDHQRGVLMSGMSDASCGMTLGRSEAWVARKRRILAGLAEPVQAIAAVASTPWSPEADPFREVEARADQTPPAVEPTRPGPRPKARPVTDRARTWSRDNRIEIVKPVTPRIVGWARRFVGADWPVETVAMLFDVDGGDLAAALAEAPQ